MKRIIVIDKCQDCNVENCKLRTMCGLIPEECQLQKDSEVNVKSSWDDAPDWANWLTYDKGGWYWWEDEPYLCEDFYVTGDNAPMKADLQFPEHYTRAIYRRPESHKEVSK